MVILLPRLEKTNNPDTNVELSVIWEYLLDITSIGPVCLSVANDGEDTVTDLAVDSPQNNIIFGISADTARGILIDPNIGLVRKITNPLTNNEPTLLWKHVDSTLPYGGGYNSSQDRSNGRIHLDNNNNIIYLFNQGAYSSPLCNQFKRTSVSVKKLKSSNGNADWSVNPPCIYDNLDMDSNQNIILSSVSYYSTEESNIGKISSSGTYLWNKFLNTSESNRSMVLYSDNDLILGGNIMMGGSDHSFNVKKVNF